MNSNRVSKLYANLTNKERANLVFSHQIQGSEQDIKTIMASVPRQTYNCEDIEYTRWYNAIWDMSSFFSREYWYLESQKYDAFCTSILLEFREEYEKSEQFYESSESYQYTIASLNCALNAVCTQHGIDANTVRKFARMEGELKWLGHLKPIPEIEIKYRERLAQILPK